LRLITKSQNSVSFLFLHYANKVSLYTYC